MKRLLAYLFIVLGLGLTFNINAYSAKYSYDKDFVCFQITNGTTFIGSSHAGWATETDSIENTCSIFVYKDHHENEYFEIISYWPWLIKKNFSRKTKVPVHDGLITKLKLDKKKFKKIRHNKKTQIAKAESSQTQKTSKKDKTPPKKDINKSLSVNDYTFYAFEYPNSNTLSRIYGTSTYNNSEAILLLENGDCKFGSNLDKLIENTKYETSFDLKCSYRVVNNNIYARVQDRINISIYPKEMKVRGINSIGKTISRVADQNKTLYLAKTYKASKLISQIERNESKTKIAKVEPSQTQKVTNGKEIKNGFVTESYWLDDKKTKPVILATYYKNDCPLYGSISYIRPKTEMVSQRTIGLYSDCNRLGPNSKLARIYFDEKGNVSRVILDKKDVTHIYGKQKYIGLDIQDTENNNGIIVKGILKDYPAEKSSLNANDLIIRINNFQVNSTQNFIKIIQEASTNQKIKIDYVPSDKINDKFDYNVSDIKTTYITPKNENTKTTLRLIYFPKEKKYLETIYKHFSSGGRESILPDEVFLKENTKDWQKRQDLLKKEYNTLYKYYSSISKLRTDQLPELDFGQFYVLSNKTQIAKQEPAIKSKKKVTKKPKLEEFKPKKTNQDNEAPIIEIAEVITVNDTEYEFQGKVTDQAKTIYVEVDGRPTDVKNGKFIVKGYSPIDKQISIEAIDQWGNRSEPKIVKLKIDIQEETVVKKLEPLNPSRIKAKTTGDKVALIIGIENYTDAPKANYANLDAKYFFDYARKGFGIKKQNINLLVDENATFVKTSKALTLWLKTKIKANQTDLVVFFAGHGLASNDGKELYLLPQDSDPNLLDITALSRTKLFKTIIDLKPKSVTMFLDTCYSGVSRDEQTLLASARPIRIMVDEQEGIPNNFTIFTASQVEQISSGIKEAKHGIFSYYLMKGLEGKADSNNDKKITNGELLAYMDEKVSQKAAELGRPQNPSLAGDPDRVLISYR